MEAGTKHCSASVADMDRGIVIDFFFTTADGRLAEISHLYGS